LVQSEYILSEAPPKADQRLSYGDDANQFVDIRVPAGKGPHSVLIFIHGGYWRAKYDLTYAGHLCHALTGKDIATCNVEYRRVGNPGGGWPGTFEDVRAAYRFIAQSAKQWELDLDHAVISGHSAGGQLAMCLGAHEPKIRNVLSLAGVLDLRRAWELHLSNDAVSEFLGGSPQQVPEHYKEASPIELPLKNVRQKVVHGKPDDAVPFELAQRYFDRKKVMKEDVELISPAGAGHFEIVDPKSRQWPQIESLIRQLLHH
jgi:acetyl esterase/lipase